MDNASKLLERVITECECDARIDSGVFDIYNADHLVVLTEHMVAYGISESIVEDAIDAMVDEGKHPDRQAYNKEGWLVTFPSKEYRDAAIKKKTHFIADPTHGQGGMNLYYKRRGKQKRQRAQSTSSTQRGGETQVSQPPAASQDQTTGTPQTQGQVPRSSGGQPVAGSAGSAPTGAGSGTGAAPAAADATSAQQPSGTDRSSSSAPSDSAKPADAPAINVPVVTQPPAEYATISKKFAAKKGWTPEPYGEYRDAQGNSMAVVGLSGEVVPIKNTDREEYKLFAEKNMPQL